jgi:2-polyprenyl-3-methyl-5-hydroxy-6-metoxy-1,4-benzoquinol methylase
MTPEFSQESNLVSRDAWDANAEVWDARMGDEGNDFFRLLCWPVFERFLAVEPGQNLLDVACGNGLTSRRLATMGARVSAFDFSANLVAYARRRDNSARVAYAVLDATDQPAMLAAISPAAPFDAALSNMALFDMPAIEPLFAALKSLLKPGGCFVFSIMHPAFNNPSSTHIVEEWDDGEFKIHYSVKTSRYITPFQSAGLGLRSQPKPQLYFHRPLAQYFQVAFAHGFVVDGFEERAFSPDVPQGTPLGWGGKFSEIPPVVIFRARLAGGYA